MCQSWSTILLLAVLSLAALATCVNSEKESSRADDVQKRSVDEDVMAEAEALAESDDMDKRSRLFRYGRGGLMRYGKRAPVFRYGKRAPAVFRYGKRAEEEEEFSPEELSRSDLLQDDVKRLFRWGKRNSYDADIDALLDNDKRAVFRYGKRVPSALDTKRRVFRFGKRGDLAGEYGRDTRVANEPHVPFRFGDE